MKRQFALLTSLLLSCGPGYFISVSAAQLTPVPPSAAPLAPERAPKPPSATVPFEPNSRGVPVVELQVNDHIAGRFLLATDNNNCYISPELADRLKVKLETVGAGDQSVQIARLSRLELGSPSVYAENVPMVVAPLSNYKGPDDKAIDGILGANALAIIAVEIDYQNEQITFWDHNNLTDTELRTAGFAHVPAATLKRVASGDYQYLVPAVVRNGGRSKAIDLMLNTDVPYNVLPVSVASDLGLSPSHPSDHPNLNAVAASNMALGSVTASAPFFAVSGDQTSLGLDTLSRYRALIDVGAGKLYLSPLVSVAPAPAYSQGLQVPFEYGASTQSKIIVRASINGKPPKPFILDTGGGGSLLLDSAAARDMGIKNIDKPGELLNGAMPVTKAHVSSMVLQGRTPADNVTVSLSEARIGDLTTIMRFAGMPIAGIIGASMLRDTAVRFDLPSHIATFYPAPLVAPMRPKSVSLPLLPTLQQNTYYVGIDFGSHTNTVMTVDTGNDNVTVPVSAISAGKARMASPFYEWLEGVLMMGEAVRLPEVKLGSISVRNLGVLVMPLNRTPSQISGTLGMAALAMTDFTLDIPHNRLLLAPPGTSPSSDIPMGWTGILMAELDNGEVQIIGAEPNSPAFKAGIKAGEKLISIDGHSTSSMGYTIVSGLLGGNSKTPVEIKVQEANGTSRTLNLMRTKMPSSQNSPLVGLFAYQYADKPMIVDSVTPGSVAARAKIQPGDAIIAIDGHPIASLTAGHYFDTYLTHVDLTIRKQGKGAPAVVHLVSPSAGKKS